MKHLLSALLFLGSLSPLQAQSKPAAFLEVVGGVNTAWGNFANSRYDDAQSGFAQPGYVLGVQGAFFLNRHLGLGMTLSQADYGVDTYALADGYRKDFAVGQATVSSNHYKFTYLLVGPYYSCSLGVLTVDLRGQVGLSVATLPALHVALEDQSRFTQNAARATSLAYQLGIGLRLPVGKKLGFSLRGDYVGTRPNFAVNYANLNNSSGRSIASYHQAVASWQATLGLFYQLGQ